MKKLTLEECDAMMVRNNGNLDLANSANICLPKGLEVLGNLDLSNSYCVQLSDSLTVNGNLNASNCTNLCFGCNDYAEYLEYRPNAFVVKRNVNLAGAVGCVISSSCIAVAGILNIRDTAIEYRDMKHHSRFYNLKKLSMTLNQLCADCNNDWGTLSRVCFEHDEYDEYEMGGPLTIIEAVNHHGNTVIHSFCDDIVDTFDTIRNFTPA